MPSNTVKSYAKKTGKKVSEIESLWKKAEEIVKDEYVSEEEEDIEEDTENMGEKVKVGSDRYYALVNGVLKKMLKLEMAYTRLQKFNKIYEDTILKFEGRNDNDEEI